MDERPTRPDPDALLQRVKDEERRARRGRLKLFFGFAPGVGKTYRMLQVARDLVSEQKADVVVGFVETHARYETDSLVLGLELLPRRRVPYRGQVLEEFDLDAALARRPAVLLVDELAHTNAPGSRHARRWQDVEELLDAGIDVMTTMNVQHVESLNDVVAQITHVRVRETVPDAVLDRADAIELVDVAPEELLARLKEGKVYLSEQAVRAAEHFFRRGNLLALRELALRRTAQHVDEDVLEYRAQHGVSAPWPAGERMLVCVGPSPSSARLIRAAARMAAGLRCPWVAAYVESSSHERLPDADRERLDAHLRLAESLGGATARLAGARVSDAVLAWARRHNVTRIIVGKPTHSRLRDRLRGSLLDELVRGSGDIDVHVITGDEPARPPENASQRELPRAPPMHYGAAAGLVAVTLGLAALLREAFALPDPEMLFLLAVMVTAARYGRGPSLLAAALGVACYDFFFVAPHFTFDVADRRYLLTFGMMFAVGFVVSTLTGRLRRQERAAVAREERTGVLYALSRELAQADTPAAIAQVAARHAADVFDARVRLVRPAPGGALDVDAEHGEPPALSTSELGAVRWALERGEAAGLGTGTLPGVGSLFAPLGAGPALGVLCVAPRDGRALGVEQRAFLDVFARQVAVALERARLADEARTAAVRARAEELRSSLLSTVSHDLRTPLGVITGAATSLRDDANLDSATRGELVDSICDEAERLERLVANLLDMTRLMSGAVTVRREWVPADEVVGSALTRLDERLRGRDVRVALPDELPLLHVDPVLVEQLFVNLLENAVKHTPAGTAVEVRGQLDDGHVLLAVRDHGPGLAAGDAERVFDKFYRGQGASSPGAGLGLAICRAIAEVHGGTLRADNHPEGGAVFTLSLPVTAPPPAVEPAPA